MEIGGRRGQRLETWLQVRTLISTGDEHVRPTVGLNSTKQEYQIQSMQAKYVFISEKFYSQNAKLTT